jgi:threonyl-tRNA synthetase
MKKKPYSLFDLRNTSSAVLALAVQQLFPAVLLAGGGATPLGFYYDFVIPSSLKDLSLTPIEELIQAWIRQKMGVKYQEMVVFSAKEYFTFHKELFLVEQIERSLDPSVCLLQFLGKMVPIQEQNFLEHLGEIQGFHLEKLEKSGQKLRIYGTAFPTKLELKEFLKVSKDWIKSSHKVIGEDKGLFEERKEGVLWLAPGQKIRNCLAEFFRQEGMERGFQEISSHFPGDELSQKTLFKDHEEAFKKSGEKQFFRSVEFLTYSSLDDSDLSSGLLAGENSQGAYCHVFCLEKHLFDELISSLHFMTKIFKILDFDFQIILVQKRKGMCTRLEEVLTSLSWEFEKETHSSSRNETRIEFRVLDGLGRSWPVCCLYNPDQLSGSNFFVFAGFISLSFERIVALLLERHQGKIPLWMSLEQLRVILLEKRHRPFAEKVVSALRENGIRAFLKEEEGELKAKLRKASKEAVSYALVIGDKEVESGLLTLTSLDSRKSNSLLLQEVVEILNQEIKRELLL